MTSSRFPLTTLRFLKDKNQPKSSVLIPLRKTPMIPTQEFTAFDTQS